MNNNIFGDLPNNKLIKLINFYMNQAVTTGYEAVEVFLYHPSQEIKFSNTMMLLQKLVM